MKILSLNINNFGGLECKEQYKKENKLREWTLLDKTSVSTEIFAYIQQEKPVVTILHEFELNTNTGNEFIKFMELIGYEIIPYEETTLKNPSITIMFVRKELLYNKLDNPHNFKSGKSLRASVIKVADCIIYGVHIPPTYDSNFWGELIDFYKKHQGQKLVIVGGYNVYDLGTEQKREYLKLLELNAKDAWLEKGYSNSTKTHIKGRRLDYTIMSPSLYECLNNIRIDSYLMNNGKTDHAALIIEI
ncbi:hypothetical protein LL037_18640 [Clostridium estertheticum]|uniref:hypothetical protein n=1 Tax=Clostridium estertheticum TaxID=238834 RepID=UPI001C0DFB5E|nr:hypothetical protein [Clostridium estertheticum]MBU3200299.1 hypothetical protein [Clostridium estertheticum]WAG64471.1 hypothetical protein LL037_18640 [Clostridium estertheticum]